MMSTYVRACSLASLTMTFVHILGLYSALDIYMKKTVCTHLPVRVQGWPNSAGGDARDFCRQASEWRIMILQVFVS